MYDIVRWASSSYSYGKSRLDILFSFSSDSRTMNGTHGELCCGCLYMRAIQNSFFRFQHTVSHSCSMHKQVAMHKNPINQTTQFYDSLHTVIHMSLMSQSATIESNGRGRRCIRHSNRRSSALTVQWPNFGRASVWIEESSGEWKIFLTLRRR